MCLVLHLLKELFNLLQNKSEKIQKNYLLPHRVSIYALTAKTNSYPIRKIKPNVKQRKDKRQLKQKMIDYD